MATAKKTPESVLRFGHIAAALRNYMKQSGRSASDIARELGISTSAPSPWIRSAGAPGPDIRPRLAKLMGIAEEQLMARNIGPSAPPPLPIATDGQGRAPMGRPRIGNRNQVLSFIIFADGTARIAFDVTVKRQRAFELFRLLSDAGIENETLTDGENEPC